MLIACSNFSDLREKEVYQKSLVQENGCWDSSVCLYFMFEQIVITFIDDYSNCIVRIGRRKAENG